jgi:hypothetical protein
MNNGFSMNNGIVNWPEIKTRRVRPNGPAAYAQQDVDQGREHKVLAVVATKLEQLKAQLVQTIQRL